MGTRRGIAVTAMAETLVPVLRACAGGQPKTLPVGAEQDLRGLLSAATDTLPTG